jgi:CheY-specific phosphatase CheX
MENQVFDIFLVAFKQIFSETGIEVQAIETGDGELQREQVVTSIGIAGTVKGNFMLCTDYASANNIIRSMTGGVEILFQSKGLGELQKTALGEMANQICGRAVTILSNKNLDCDMTPPIIITAEKLTSHIPDVVMSISHIVRGPFGVLRLFIALSSVAGPNEKTS